MDVGAGARRATGEGLCLRLRLATLEGCRVALGVRVLVRPALTASEVLDNRCAPLALCVLGPLAARRLLVAVEPLARAAHLAEVRLAVTALAYDDRVTALLEVGVGGHRGRLAGQGTHPLRIGLLSQTLGAGRCRLGCEEGRLLSVHQVRPVGVEAEGEEPLSCCKDGLICDAALGSLAQPLAEGRAALADPRLGLAEGVVELVQGVCLGCHLGRFDRLKAGRLRHNGDWLLRITCTEEVGKNLIQFFYKLDYVRPQGRKG